MHPSLEREARASTYVHFVVRLTPRMRRTLDNRLSEADLTKSEAFRLALRMWLRTKFGEAGGER